jgi:hypothetical protein
MPLWPYPVYSLREQFDAMCNRFASHPKWRPWRKIVLRRLVDSVEVRLGNIGGHGVLTVEGRVTHVFLKLAIYFTVCERNALIFKYSPRKGNTGVVLGNVRLSSRTAKHRRRGPDPTIRRGRQESPSFRAGRMSIFWCGIYRPRSGRVSLFFKDLAPIAGTLRLDRLELFDRDIRPLDNSAR